jgi:hypothetical protein
VVERGELRCQCHLQTIWTPELEPISARPKERRLRRSVKYYHTPALLQGYDSSWPPDSKKLPFLNLRSSRSSSTVLLIGNSHPHSHLHLIAEA